MTANKTQFERIVQLERDLAAALAELASVRGHAEAMEWAIRHREPDYATQAMKAYRAAHPKDTP